MNIEAEVIRFIHVDLTEDEASILRALVQNPPTNAGADVRNFMEKLFLGLDAALRKP